MKTQENSKETEGKMQLAAATTRTCKIKTWNEYAAHVDANDTRRRSNTKAKKMKMNQNRLLS